MDSSNKADNIAVKNLSEKMDAGMPEKIIELEQLFEYKNEQQNNLVNDNIMSLDNRLQAIINNLADPVKSWLAKQNTETKQGKIIKNLATVIRNLQVTRENQLLQQVSQLLKNNEKPNKETNVINYYALQCLNELLEKLNNTYVNKEVIGEFIIKKVTLISDFTNDIKATIINKMKNIYPSYDINENFQIEFENLTNNDIVQGQEINIKIKPVKSTIIKVEVNFIIKINYQYDSQQQKIAAAAILQKAIPPLFWNDRKNKQYFIIWRHESCYATIAEMIKDVKPLPILLTEPYLGCKIMVETFAASYWTAYHTDFWGLWLFFDYGYGARYTNIPHLNHNLVGNMKNINSIEIISELNKTYFDKLFCKIEQYLNQSGINCVVTKKAVKDNESNLYLYGVGNVEFNNQENANNRKKRQYYIQVNFDLLFTANDGLVNAETEEFAGVVLALSDDLTLYSAQK